MEQWNKKMLVVMVFMMTALGGVAGYKNYTVGGDLGWFDKLEKPTVDYQKWASSKTFSLGDFLTTYCGNQKGTGKDVYFSLQYSGNFVAYFLA
ncbi:Cupredoxin [Artemisia annua]|uniref:Cupredoxin n=1 Tax=Artemisia annua TaxID=35608 RepID=A0A2U1KE17_ARTAN|nr:Cupredoxin [Artemisia annua]